MFTHNLEPILFNLGFIEIRWYSLAYIFGILIGWWYAKKIILVRFKIEGDKFSLKEFDDSITILVLSIIIGGRMGYVFFYNPSYYLLYPLDILKIWQGGMSFHGALIGIIVGIFLFSKKRKLNTLFLLDVISCVAPIGIFFGRVANFINSELVGKITNVPWSVIFPNQDMMSRHPSQLYEALLEGVFLFIILNFLIYKKEYKTGTCSFLFLIFYGSFRIVGEWYREPDSHIGYLFGFLSMGTILSLIMILSGLILYLFFKKNEI